MVPPITAVKDFSLEVKASKYLHTVFIYTSTPRGVFKTLVIFNTSVVLTVSQLIYEKRLKMLMFGWGCVCVFLSVSSF